MRVTQSLGGYRKLHRDVVDLLNVGEFAPNPIPQYQSTISQANVPTLAFQLP
jgi:hypothetical protein